MWSVIIDYVSHAWPTQIIRWNQQAVDINWLVSMGFRTMSTYSIPHSASIVSSRGPEKQYQWDRGGVARQAFSHNKNRVYSTHLKLQNINHRVVHIHVAYWEILLHLMQTVNIIIRRSSNWVLKHPLHYIKRNPKYDAMWFLVIYKSCHVVTIP